MQQYNNTLTKLLRDNIEAATGVRPDADVMYFTADKKKAFAESVKKQTGVPIDDYMRFFSEMMRDAKTSMSNEGWDHSSQKKKSKPVRQTRQTGQTGAKDAPIIDNQKIIEEERSKDQPNKKQERERAKEEATKDKAEQQRILNERRNEERARKAQELLIKNKKVQILRTLNNLKNKEQTLGYKISRDVSKSVKDTAKSMGSMFRISGVRNFGGSSVSQGALGKVFGSTGNVVSGLGGAASSMLSGAGSLTSSLTGIATTAFSSVASLIPGVGGVLGAGINLVGGSIGLGMKAIGGVAGMAAGALGNILSGGIGILGGMIAAPGNALGGTTAGYGLGIGGLLLGLMRMQKGDINKSGQGILSGASGIGAAMSLIPGMEGTGLSIMIFAELIKQLPKILEYFGFNKGTIDGLNTLINDTLPKAFAYMTNTGEGGFVKDAKDFWGEGKQTFQDLKDFIKEIRESQAFKLFTGDKKTVSDINKAIETGDLSEEGKPKALIGDGKGFWSDTWRTIVGGLQRGGRAMSSGEYTPYLTSPETAIGYTSWEQQKKNPLLMPFQSFGNGLAALWNYPGRMAYNAASGITNFGIGALSPLGKPIKEGAISGMNYIMGAGASPAHAASTAPSLAKSHGSDVIAPASDVSGFRDMERNTSIAPARNVSAFKDIERNQSLKEYIAKGESGGNYQAPQSWGGSTAYGKYQMIDSTFANMLKRIGYKFNSADLKELKKDPTLQERTADEYAKVLAETLRKNDLPVTKENIRYLWFGGEGRVDSLKAIHSGKGNMRVEDFFTEAQLKANPHIRGKTLSELNESLQKGSGGSSKASVTTSTEEASGMNGMLFNAVSAIRKEYDSFAGEGALQKLFGAASGWVSTGQNVELYDKLKALNAQSEPDALGKIMNAALDPFTKQIQEFMGDLSGSLGNMSSTVVNALAPTKTDSVDEDDRFLHLILSSQIMNAQ